MRSNWRLTLGIAVVLGAFGSAEGAIRFVNASAPAGGNGQSWATAYKYLRDALSAAWVPGSGITEIWVAAGTYRPDRDAAHPSGTGNRAASFSLISGVTIRGGFAGNEAPATFDLTTRDFVANTTTLSGDLAGNDGPNFANNAENSYHVVSFTSGTSVAVLDGVAIVGGNANSSNANSPTDDEGGGIYNERYCTIALSHCTFRQNSALTGGCLSNYGTATLTDCSFDANSSTQHGGCIDVNQDSSVTCARCVFTGNSGSPGGAIAGGGTLALDACTFSKNSSPSGGGAIWYYGEIHAQRCRFNFNTALPPYGGGAFSYGGNSPDVSIAFSQCVFVGNSGQAGGAIGGVNFRAQLTNCTVVGNRASVSSGGIDASGTSIITVNNCILWGNDGPQINAHPGATIVSYISYSCVQGGATGTNNISADPRLTSLEGDPRLRSGSPCIDAGSNSALSLDVTADLSGGPRYIDDISTPDTGDAGVPARPVVDMGAYEYASVPAQRLYVNASAASGGDGSSWSSAYRYLQDALAAAEARPEVLEIWVAGGVYRPDRDDAHPSGTGSRAVSFNLPGAVAIYGGFPGQPGQEGDFTVRNPGAYSTDLSGDLASNDGTSPSNNTENSYHVVNASWTGLSTLFDGFRISGGNANGTAPDDCGAGIYAPGVGPTVRNCQVYANTAKTNGGGLYAESPIITNCTFAQNSASAGGGIYNLLNWNATGAVLTNCTVVGNTGGGIYNWSAISAQVTSQVINCIIWGNTGSQLTQSYGTLMVMYSCVQGGWSGAGNMSADPKLAFVAGGDLRLRKGSPCVDAGLNARVPADVTVDASGAARFVDDPETMDTGAGGSQAGVVDMGACEYQPGPAKRLYVQEGAADGDGLTQATAFAHLQDALKLAQSDPNVTEIWVGTGVYRPDRAAAHPDGTGDRTATFSLPGAIRVYGAFPTGTAIDWTLADRDAAANPTILSGDLAGDDGPNFANNGENTYHVVDASWTTTAALLDGLTIASGNANGTGTAAYGGGMYIGSGGPTINACTFAGNGSGSGGGLYVPSGASPVLSGCRFTSNKAVSGGGMWNASSAASVMSCTFSGNSATSSGGGLFNSGSAIKMVNGVFSGNSAPSGGGVYSNGGSPALVNCTLFGNGAVTAGGGFFGMRSTPTLTNCIVWGNSAPAGAQISGAATTTYSCVQGGATGQGNTGLDPLFVNAGAGELRLSATSPCIDAGSNAAVPGGTLFDATGRVRFMDIPGIADCPYAPGTCGTGAIVDMGAYEFIPTRSIVQWRSVRSHSGAGALSVVLNPTAVGTASTEVTVEARGMTNRGLGLEMVEVDFDGPVSLGSRTDVAVTCWPTVNGTPGAPSTIVPVVTAVDADTLRFQVAGVADASCVRVQIGTGAINENLTGDVDCMIRSLAGDVSGDGQVTLSDLALARTHLDQVAGVEPRLDVTLDGRIALSDLSFIKWRMTSPPRVAVCP